MKTFFACAISLMIVLSLVAWSMKPKHVSDGKLTLIWVSDDSPVRREQAELFNRLNPRYNVRLDPGNAGMQKIIVQSLAGVGPDLLDCYKPLQLADYVKSGIAWDITDELRRAGIDVESDVWKVALPMVMYEGRVYGFPTNAGSTAIWYNKDIFDRHGVPYPKGPWTWDELVKVAKQLTIKDKNGRIVQYGLLCDWSGPNLQQFVMQWGGRMYSEDGTRCTIDSPEAIAGVQFMHDLVYKHHVTPSPVEEQTMSTQGGWGSGSITLFSGERAAMALGGRFWLCLLRQNESLRVGAVECAHGPHRVFVGGAKSTLVNRNSPRRREALEFLKHLASNEHSQLINHQADGLGPVVRHCYTPEFLRDPDYAEEDYNQVWLDSMIYAAADPISPFISGNVAGRIMQSQIDIVKNDQKPVADALKTTARLVNAEIRKNLERDPSLRARYQELTRRSGR